MTKLTVRQRGEIALHEASHAIAGLRLGFDIKRVHVRPGTAGQLGECRLLPGMAFDGDADRIAAAHAIVALSGLAAQRRLSSSEFGGQHQVHDIAAVADLILRLDDGSDVPMALDDDAERRHLIENLQMYEMLRTRADTLVREHRASVVRVARALIERDELSGDDVKALIAAESA